MSDVDPRTSDALTPRVLLGRHLLGHGLEIGPGESPFVLPFVGTVATSADQWGSEDNARLFREIDSTRFAEPDRRVDLNVDRLSAFDDESQDFVIASHVLEHLVEPIGQLVDIWRVLRPGGALLFLLPDRRRTFDRDRAPTPLSHLVDEYHRGVTELDDAHLIEFTMHVVDDWGDAEPPRDEAERFERHRQRSIHVHCWTEDEFIEVISYVIEHLGLPWELVDRLGTDDVPGSIEFGFVLRRPTIILPAEIAARRLRRVWSALVARADERIETQRALDGVRVELNQTRDDLASVRDTLARHEKVLAPIRKFGVVGLARRVSRRR